MTESEFTTQSYWFIFQNERLLFLKDSQSPLPTNSLLPLLKPYFVRQYKLGVFNDITCYCAEINLTTLLPNIIETIPLRNAFELLGQDWYTAAAKALSILSWDKNHQFCGRCGGLTAFQQEDLNVFVKFVIFLFSENFAFRYPTHSK